MSPMCHTRNSIQLFQAMGLSLWMQDMCLILQEQNRPRAFGGMHDVPDQLTSKRMQQETIL